MGMRLQGSGARAADGPLRLTACRRWPLGRCRCCFLCCRTGSGMVGESGGREKSDDTATARRDAAGAAQRHPDPGCAAAQLGPAPW